MLFHAFDCLSLPLLYRSAAPFHHVSFHFHAIPFLNCTVLGYSHAFPHYTFYAIATPALFGITSPCHFIAVQSTPLISTQFHCCTTLRFSLPILYFSLHKCAKLCKTIANQRFATLRCSNAL